MQCEMPRALVEPTRRASSAEPPAMVAASMISMSRWRESSLSCSSRSNMTIYANGTNHWFEGSTAERRGPFRGLCRAQNAPEGAARLEIQVGVVAHLEECTQQASDVSAEQCRAKRYTAKQLNCLHG